MQPSMQLLYDTASKKDINTPSAVARMLGASQQTLKNWDNRGISKEGAMMAQQVFGLDANALLALNVKEEPALTAQVTTGDAGIKPLISKKPERSVVKKSSYDQWTVEAIKILNGLKPSQKEGAVANLRTYVQNLGPPIKSTKPAPKSAAA